MSNDETPRRGNPAALLHDLFADLLERAPQEPLPRAWATVFGLPTEELAPVLVGLSHVHELPDRIVDALAANPLTAGEETLLAWQAPVKAALDGSLHLGNAVESVQRQLQGNGAMASLASIAVILKHTTPDLPPFSVVADMLETLNAFEAQVLASDDLPADLRAFLLSQIREIRDALYFVRVRGPEGLTRALEGGLGAALLRPEPERKHPLFQKFGQVWHALANVVGFGDSAIAVGAFIAGQITS